MVQSLESDGSHTFSSGLYSVDITGKTRPLARRYSKFIGGDIVRIGEYGPTYLIEKLQWGLLGELEGYKVLFYSGEEDIIRGNNRASSGITYISTTDAEKHEKVGDARQLIINTDRDSFQFLNTTRLSGPGVQVPQPEEIEPWLDLDKEGQKTLIRNLIEMFNADPLFYTRMMQMIYALNTVNKMPEEPTNE